MTKNKRVHQGYVQPGAYLYAFVTVDEHGEMKGLSRCTDPELSPEEMKQIALESTEEEDVDDK